jgi:hypothetical protein
VIGKLRDEPKADRNHIAKFERQMRRPMLENLELQKPAQRLPYTKPVIVKGPRLSRTTADPNMSKGKE